jgi:hypothetical protein
VTVSLVEETPTTVKGMTMKNLSTDTRSPAKPGRKAGILVVANEALEEAVLPAVVGPAVASGPSGAVLVIAPALNSRLRHWVSDEDEARRRAGLRLDRSLEALEAVGIEAEGRVGDADPLQAIADALTEFVAGEIVIASAHSGRPHRLTRDLAERTRRRFAPPVREIVVAGAARGESVRRLSYPETAIAA